ncbi:Rho termination factor [Jiella endophytica]|uniref:Rho termination factor n=1 Tax=Jiella endophytica TaxID=2558362 RepID=A0A4Y8RJ63_9HYPH|nr:Rho termination factor N-terminal domain-containing protein [Jiella endophytica]TFF23089.1 Rho termination factor [Jiella endophytica]
MAKRSSNANDNSSLKDPELYEELRDQGYSKEKSARISNAKANPDMHPSKRGGKAPPYEEWTKDELYARAKEIGVEGRSDMTKDDLIAALRGG